jgi:hypothetical protein
LYYYAHFLVCDVPANVFRIPFIGVDDIFVLFLV